MDVPPLSRIRPEPRSTVSSTAKSPRPEMSPTGTTTAPAVSAASTVVRPVTRPLNNMRYCTLYCAPATTGMSTLPSAPVAPPLSTSRGDAGDGGDAPSSLVNSTATLTRASDAVHDTRIAGVVEPPCVKDTIEAVTPVKARLANVAPVTEVVVRLSSSVAGVQSPIVSGRSRKTISHFRSAVIVGRCSTLHTVSGSRRRARNVASKFTRSPFSSRA